MAATEIDLPALGFTASLAAVISVLLGFVEVPYRSKTAPPDCLTWQFAIYLLIFAGGNVITSFLASVFLSTVDLPGTSALRPVWYSFAGVFGFELVLKNVGLTLFNQGFSLNEWTSKARDNAVAAANARSVERGLVRIENMSQKLAKQDEGELNASLLQHLGADAITRIEEGAKKGGADVRLCKAYALAHARPDVCTAMIRAIRTKAD